MSLYALVGTVAVRFFHKKSGSYFSNTSVASLLKKVSDSEAEKNYSIFRKSKPKDLSTRTTSDIEEMKKKRCFENE